MQANLKAVLFDIDDTLFDRVKARSEIIALIMHEYQYLFAGLDQNDVEQAFFESDDVAIREFNAGASMEQSRRTRSRTFLNLLGLDKSRADEITESYLRFYPLVNTPVTGAKTVVTSLFGKFQLGVVSNGSPDVQHHKLASLLIGNLLRCIVLSEEVGIRKPDPNIFLKAASLLGRRPEECLHVGDSYAADVVGAKCAGMLSCWFNPRGLELPSTGYKPDIQIASLPEILQILGCARD